MKWQDWLPIIAQFGVERAFAIWEIVSKHETVTAEAWQELRTVNKKPLQAYVEEAAAAAGLPAPPAPPEGTVPPS